MKDGWPGRTVASNKRSQRKNLSRARARYGLRHTAISSRRASANRTRSRMFKFVSGVASIAARATMHAALQWKRRPQKAQRQMVRVCPQRILVPMHTVFPNQRSSEASIGLAQRGFRPPDQTAPRARRTSLGPPRARQSAGRPATEAACTRAWPNVTSRSTRASRSSIWASPARESTTSFATRVTATV